MKNWDQEVALLQRWCEIVGVGEHEIVKPTDSTQAIGILFDEPLSLEVPAISSGDEEEDEEEDEWDGVAGGNDEAGDDPV